MSKKKIILITVGVIVAIISGLFYYVTHIDWNAQKENIAARFSKTSGRKIEFTGNLSVSLFPSPHLVASDVNILNDETSEKLATVDTLEAELSLRALLKGIPDIQSMTLIGSEFWWIVDENGVSNWHQKQKSQLLDIDIETGLQKLNVRNSVIHYHNRKHEFKQELKQVNAEILAKSLVGPYRLDGNFVKDNDHFGVAVNIGDFSQSDDVSFSFALTHPHSESFLRYDGTYNFLSGNFKGDLSGNAKRAADFINILLGDQLLSDEFNRQLLFSVTAQSTKKTLKLSSFAVKFRDYLEGSGSVVVPWPTAEEPHPLIDIQYQMVNVNLQPLVVRLQQYMKRLQQNQEKYIPDWPFNIQFNLESERVILSNLPGGFVENVSVKGSWQNNEFNIDDAYIACPGNIVLTMAGNVRSEKDLPRYFAKVKFEGKYLLEFLNAFGAGITPPNQSAYRNINLDFSVSGDPINAVINEAKMIFDKANYDITGNFDFSSENPSAQLKIIADKVNFDNYLPSYKAEADMVNIMIEDFQKLAFLKDKNWKINYSSDSSIIRGIPFAGLKFQMGAQKDVLNLVDVTTDDVLGSKVRCSADIGGLGTAEPVIQAFEYDISTTDISPILTKFQVDFPYIDLIKNKNIQSFGSVKGQIEQADVNLNAQIGNLKLNYRGEISKKQEIDFNGYGELKTLNLGELISHFGDQYKKLSANSVFNCTGQIQGHSHDWHFTGLECMLGTAQYAGDLELKETGDILDIKGNIVATEFDLSSVLDIEAKQKQPAAKALQNTFWSKPNWSADVIHYDGLKNKIIDLNLETGKAFYENLTFNNFVAHIQNSENNLSLENLNFAYNGADYSGMLQVDYSQNPKVSGTIRGGNIHLSNIGGSIYKVTDGNLNFSSTFSADATSIADFIKSITGLLEFVIDDININGFYFDAIVKDLQTREYAKGLFQVVHDNLQKGFTFFENVTGQVEIKQGVMNITQLSLKNKDVSINVKGEVIPNEWQTKNEWAVTFNERPDVPIFMYTLNGSINKPDLEIKIDDIVKKYDEFWEKEAAMKRQQKEAEQREKERLMNNAQQQVSVALSRFKEVHEAYIAGRSKTDMPSSLAAYDKYLTQLGDIQTQLLDMQALPQRQNYENEDSKKIEQDALKYLDEIKDIELQLQSIYDEDARARFAATKETVQTMKDNNTRFYDSYQKMLQDKFADLRKYKSVSYMLNNDKLLGMQREIDQLRDDFWEKCYQFSDKFTQYFGLEQISDLENATNDLKQSIAGIEDIQNQMNNLQQQMESKLDEIIAERKVVYEEEEAKAAAEEAARLALEEMEKAAADASQKSEKKKGKEVQSTDKLTPTKFHKAENKPSEEKQETSEKPAQVKAKTTLEALDNILTNHEVSGTITKSYEEIPEYKIPGWGVLEPLEGKIPETSGKIIVK